MGNAQTFRLSDTVVSILAIVLTIGDICFKASVLVMKKSVSFSFQTMCILLLAAAIILAFILVMTISTTTGPWLNTHLQ